MTKPSSEPSLFAQRLEFLLYRVVARVSEVLPVSAVEPISRAGAAIAVRVMRKRRELLIENFTPVLGKKPDRAFLKKTFASYIRFWIESLRLGSVPASWLRDNFEIEGVEQLHSVTAEKRGAIIALAHMGNWDVAAAWLANNGNSLSVVAEQLASKDLFEWFVDFRQSIGIEVLTNDRNLATTLATRLNAGKLVALLCDRDVNNGGKPATFFGKQASIVRGPAVLALRTDAPLVPVAIYQEPKGKHRVVIGSPLDTARKGAFRDDVERVTADLLREFEKMILVAPEQWHAFSPFWPKQPNAESKL